MSFFYISQHHYTLITTLFPYTTLFRSRESPRCYLPREDLRCAFCFHRSPPVSSARPLFTLRPSTSSSRSTPAEETGRSEEHTSELQSHSDIVCRLLLVKK